ncbi:MAG: FAD-binding protein [Alphaproteobacteria bacterium]|jgi:aspartate oxidase|nr:FAD-binding protein [Alphaproteobacteria bacterium]MDP6565746.1 FAD-binding protein [Alphaproteobacteria bacterium]MDP6815342.1 FAD-binding protein [Alphaproteobacteria bacterium]
METLRADVWVIGSGAAGLMAAITARLDGADVAVVGKSGPGKGTSTTFAVGAFSGPWEGLSEEAYKERVLTAGRGLNETDMVDIAAAEAPARFQDLIDWGLTNKSAPGVFMALPKDDPGDRIPVWGREIVRCLVAKAQEVGVRFVDNLVVRSIAAGADGVCLRAYGARRRRWLELRGGAAILAAGGAGALFLHHDNPQRIGGDSHTLAYEAGCVMQDLEFVQFYPVAIAEPDKPVFLIEPEGADLGHLVNADGEDILDKYDITVRPAATHARDALSQALFQEIEQHDGAVYIDLTHVAKETWCANPISATKWAYLDANFNAWKQRLRVAPVAHFSGGGARTDLDGATSVPGFYAAGEAAGGMHGANRMGGNALTECLVFGHRAGAAATAFAQGRDQGARAPAPAPTLETGEPQADPDDLRTELRQVMWQYGGIRRDAEGLATGLAKVRDIAAQAARTRGINEPRRLEKFLETQLAAGAAELIIQAATRRQESRGTHARADYPASDDENWRGHLKVERQADGPHWWFDPLPAEDGTQAAE